MQTLKDRAKRYVKELGIPVTVFSKRIGISTTAYNRWQRDDLKLAEATEKRIEDYLNKVQAFIAENDNNI